MIMLPNVRTHLNSYIDKKSNNILLIFPNQRLKLIYKIYCQPKKNEILVNVYNLSKQLVGQRFKEYKFMSFNEVKKIRQESFKRFESKILNGTCKEEPRGLLDTIQKEIKPVKYKPRNKKHNYIGLQDHHIIVDEIHEWKNNR